MAQSIAIGRVPERPAQISFSPKRPIGPLKDRSFATLAHTLLILPGLPDVSLLRNGTQVCDLYFGSKYCRMRFYAPGMILTCQTGAHLSTGRRIRHAVASSRTI